MATNERWRLKITGIVQGVGFRPCVYSLAVRHRLGGFVLNDSSGVTIEIEGRAEALKAFAHDLRTSPPPLAHIETFDVEPIALLGNSGGVEFSIQASEPRAGESTPISPDIATCGPCLREMNDPADRRYRYPFLNCTDCGPRFTIIRDIPYDRPFTTMAGFKMCAECEREYHDPLNRRFHAQPNACPKCGPQLSFSPGGQIGEAALAEAKQMLAAGNIVAIKGLGGFHLACDATCDAALAELRRRKGRVDKPFALMARDLEMVRRFAHVNDEEARLLESRQRPIVLLRAKDPALPSPLVAPGNLYLGFFLPYSPLHHLLLDDKPLVMTSGNRSDEPIARDNHEALERLATLTDGFLLHNRDIHVVCDDSVVRVLDGREFPVRRSRGYAPMPVHLPSAGPRVLATGGELKATLCLTREDHAYMSQHIGDMENLETLGAFERAFEHLRALFRAEPERVVCDLHPGYLSTRWARDFAAAHGLPLKQAQHHHAHIASLMAENGLDGNEPVIGVSFDGTGYGTDGAIWGGELLLADYRSFRRLGHLKYIPLPGGDASVKRPYRMALAHLTAAGLPLSPDLPCIQAVPDAERQVLDRQLATGFNCVPTSSMGRVFDAAASILGLRHTVTYEAQGAMELEAVADPACRDGYAFEVESAEDGQTIFNPAPVWRKMVADLKSRTALSTIAARFHRAVAALIVASCKSAREQTGVSTVALSGGVFQNVLLLQWAREGLLHHGFHVMTHQLAPPNDGGLALGQAAIGRCLE